jgi:protease I
VAPQRQVAARPNPLRHRFRVGGFDGFFAPLFFASVPPTTTAKFWNIRGIRGWEKRDWGLPVKVDKALAQVTANDYDAIILPGGQINPDLLRVNDNAPQLIKDVFNQKKVAAAVCHAPWLLIETGIIKGRKVTSYKSIKTDVINAGCNWEDSQVVVDQGAITSRNPGDLEAFSAKIIEEVLEANTPSAARLEPGWPSRAALGFEKSILVAVATQVLQSPAIICRTYFSGSDPDSNRLSLGTDNRASRRDNTI